MKKESNRNAGTPESSTLVGRLNNVVKEELGRSNIRRVVAGISGGADSVALLHSLLAAGAEVVGVHCNFHLRGDESDSDMRFVEDLCHRLDVRLDIVHFDVDTYRRKNGGSVEMACRDLRYDYFRRIMREESADRIVVAHNSDDNAETVLLNLFRGAGVAGLSAMSPDNGEIIRPLLTVSRSDIEGYLGDLGEKYVIDSTNLSSEYRRNYIRNEVFPLLEREWPGVKRSINHTAAIMREERKASAAIFSRMVTGDLFPMIRMEDAEIGYWLLRRFIVAKGGFNDVAEDIWRGYISKTLVPGRRWIGEGGEFIMGRDGLEWVEEKYCREGVDVTGEFEYECIENSLSLLERIQSERNNDELWIPFIPDDIIFRTWKKGDRIRPLGMKGSRLVSDILAESGLGQREKRTLALAQSKSTEEIIWVEGLKRSRHFLIDETHPQVWRVKRKLKM